MTDSSTTAATSPVFCCASQLAGNTVVRNFSATSRRIGPTLASTSVSNGDSVSMITSDTANITTFASPIGRNISKPCTSATSELARDTSCPVESSS